MRVRDYIYEFWSLYRDTESRVKKGDLKRGIRNTDKCITSSNVPMVSPVTT